MNLLLEKLAGVAARKHWIFIIIWVVILGGLLAAKHAFGGEYVNTAAFAGKVQTLLETHGARWTEQAIQQVLPERARSAINTYVKAWDGQQLMRELNGRYKAQVELEIGVVAEDVDVDPSGAAIGAASEV